MKILLVDDEKFAINGLISTLHWDAFDGELIGTASNGKEALELAIQNSPDVIISDIKMPIMDGLELAQAVANSPMNIELILLSAHDNFQYAQQAISCGVNQYILKPITREKINQLEALLIHINETKLHEKQQLLQTWDHSLKENIVDALNTSNHSYFNEYFQSDLFLSYENHSNFNALGMQLIHYLFYYLNTIHINKVTLEKSQQKAIAEFLDLPTIELKQEYIIVKYYDILAGTNTVTYSNTEETIKHIIELINANYQNPVFNVTYLANEINLTISYLSTFFKQATSSNLSDYITDLRMEEAKRLLTNTRDPIICICTECGYLDAKYFAKIFKKTTGLTPSEYRTKHKLGTQYFTPEPLSPKG